MGGRAADHGLVASARASSRPTAEGAASSYGAAGCAYREIKQNHMAKFLTTSGIVSSTEEAIRSASQSLTIITPFLKMSPEVVLRLRDAVERGVKVRLVYGKESLASGELVKLAELPNVQLFFLQRLHAKCCLNEFQAVIGSMNLYEFSEKNNREMGVLLHLDSDGDQFRRVAEEAESIIHEAMQERLRGTCIRCGTTIPFSADRPLCDACFTVWVAWRNDEFEEKFCHACGSPAPTCRARPLCRECFRSMPFDRTFA